MKVNCKTYLIQIVVIVSGFCLASCANDSKTVPEAAYPAKIVGKWLGTVENTNETMSFHADGTFACKVHPMGFIANTLSQGVTEMVYGTWKITGATITLKMTGSDNEHLENRIAVSTIESFKTDEIILKSDKGGSSSFQRIQAHWYNVFKKTNAEL